MLLVLAEPCLVKIADNPTKTRDDRKDDRYLQQVKVRGPEKKIAGDDEMANRQSWVRRSLVSSV